ncbi:TPA: preprotein translocase subunit SecA [Clostridioides difficile]|uniref:preprotein translocase subunit SecA n=1 Tax=Clostridioides difficile TaxID=1496 RepID=UPI0007BC603B|nr:preprotein translocase subunit SecA [Clostridioides difficile]EGT4187012.1 preprotein translocase subunit SecA [Clostridioides difficile]EGT4217103.1 preprotein translocase subunit SecA [Clostridioides difficile]MCR1519627.1 preprotein translocase subunit SecA [Clostridioides difficile]MCW0823440.1 preprotein translocase subunit SecA [Clostridioides difficile]CZR74366.1 protein translocase subunit secA 2 [Clostridium difficile 630] [Clostridioides difficile]
MSVIDTILDKADEQEIKKLNVIVDKIDALEESMKKLSDEELKDMTAIFKNRLEKGETLDDILPEAFAVVREVSKRKLGMRQYRVQLIGGIVIHQGKIAEMKTGEGKTLVEVAPVYLNALTGKGVHVITVNDYLAERDKELMRPVYESLDMTVGVIISNQDPSIRKQQYKCDITYGTNSEFGFDYLRDNMVPDLSYKVQRELNFAIVDEVDSILIDEARTPLIIAGDGDEDLKLYELANSFVKTVKEEDFEMERKDKTIALTASGISKAESFFGITNLTDIKNIELYHHINQALRGHKLMEKDVDYVISNGEVMIVDEFTGRVMDGRRYTDGLHQAIEAKEGVEIKNESKTMATVTYQNFFRLYEKLSGMTGTAKTEEGEFESIYKLNVVQIPTNKPVIRADLHDKVFKTEEEKYSAVVEEIIRIHKTRQPILVGTVSVEKSEKLSKMLKKQGIKHQVLNAKQHDKEAEIISKAGKLDAITIATNMAGRGTDISLGAGDKEEEQEVKDLGGLYVIGTERHESRRIDNQLRGRSGRQGDPGTSRFFVSLEDDVIKLYGGKTIEKLMKRTSPKENTAIESKALTRAIERAQKGVEGKNFEIRKNVLKYDDTINEQRKVIYNERNKVLNDEDIKEDIQKMVKDIIQEAGETYLIGRKRDYYGYFKHLYSTFMPADTLLIPGVDKKSVQEIIDSTYEISKRVYDLKKMMIGIDKVAELEKTVLLKVVDQYWIDHIDAMEQLRQYIGLKSYAQKDPFKEYALEGYDMFEALNKNIREATVQYLYKFN